ncbi:MAG: hypothetical protein AB7O68_18895 [Pirellulales bacterium]
MAAAQSAAEMPLYEKLQSPKERVEAVKTVLARADGHSAGLLYMTAGAAFRDMHLEDSAFLFYAARLRAQFDRECFPATGTGGDSPFVAFNALAQELGQRINPAIMAKPEMFAKVIDRLKQWEPKAPEDYDPGYDYSERKSEEAAIQATAESRKTYVDGLSDLSTLLQDVDYFAAFKVMQAYNLGPLKDRPSDEEYAQAVETIKRIEKEKGIDALGNSLD